MSDPRNAPQSVTSTPAGRILLLAALAVAIIGAVVGVTQAIRGFASGGASATVVPHLTRGTLLFTTNDTNGSAYLAFSIASPAASPLAIAGSIGEVILCVLAAILAIRLLRGRVFSRALSIAVAIDGLVVTILGAIYEVGTASRSSSDVLGLTLIVTGVLLLLFGLAVRHGRQLAADTEGLV
jgi:hypothetical protein